VADPDTLVLDPAKQFPSSFRQPDFIWSQEIIPALEQNGCDFAAIRSQQDLRPWGETFRSADRAIAPHDDDWLALGVKPYPLGPKGCFLAIVHGFAASMPFDYMATKRLTLRNAP
jgi:hypothetical protein